VVAEIRIDAIDPATMALWRTVAKIARALQEEQERWCLVGGLMVALYAIQAGQIQRPTTDIDLLGDARQRPSGTEWVSDRLRDLGASRRRDAPSHCARRLRPTHGLTSSRLAKYLETCAFALKRRARPALLRRAACGTSARHRVRR
jgi:hypothetical protein